MRLFRATILALSVASWVFVLAPTSVSAYNLEGGCKWGTDQIPFYDNSGSYSSETAQAKTYWDATPTNIIFVSVSSNADVEAISGYYGSTGWDGLTTFNSCSNSRYSPITVSYYNTYYTNGYDFNGKVQVMVHELGHALGLAHNNPTPCGIPIMYFSSNRYFQCGLYKPQTDDINGINHLYPN